MTVASSEPKTESALLPRSSGDNASLLSQILAIGAQRNLLSMLVGRDLSGRYRGSMLGRLWPLLHPLGQLLIYTFVFSIVLKIRFADNPSPGSFALYFMAGLIPWSIFAESTSRSSTVILENPNLVSKVVFPTEILPLVNVFSAFCTQVFASVVLAACAVFYLGKIQVTLLYLPLVLIPLLSFTAGLSWFLAAFGVFVRDTRHMVSLALQAGMYATPILYPSKSVPPEYQWVIFLNPIAGVVEDFRRILLDGTAPDWQHYPVYLFMSLAMAVLGLSFFLKTKKSFADVM